LDWPDLNLTSKFCWIGPGKKIARRSAQMINSVHFIAYCFLRFFKEMKENDFPVNSELTFYYFIIKELFMTFFFAQKPQKAG
jgi:hypothetical protein